MFNKNEVREFIIKYGKKWFFPDFSNKLTWFVLSLGGTILIIPTALEQLFYNWLVATINLNSGVPITLAELQTSSAEYVFGLSLVAFALAHNIANSYFIYKTTQFQVTEVQATLDADRLLFQQFLSDFPSDSDTIKLLKEHDFGNSYFNDSTTHLDIFVEHWNNTEKNFLDHELERKRKKLWAQCNTFVHKLALGSFFIDEGTMLSTIPDNYRCTGEWPEHVDAKIEELNELATKCFNTHQQLILLGRQKLKC